MRQRQGSVVLDRRIRTWNLFWWENGKRHSKKIGKYPSKAAAWRAAKPLRDAVENKTRVSSNRPIVSTLVDQCRAEKMPQRFSTRRSYDAWLNNHVLPRWGECAIQDVQARPVELWLQALSLTPKSKVHIRGVIGLLWDFAMWRGDIATQRNPMELVTVKGASRRTRKPCSLTVEEFQKFAKHLEEPFRTMALVCVCFGLRISECLALQ